MKSEELKDNLSTDYTNYTNYSKKSAGKEKARSLKIST